MTEEESSIQGGGSRQVQARRQRKDGWTPAKRRIFLDHLAATANVERSAEAAGMESGGAFRLRRRDPDFAELWQEALVTGYARLEAMLIERATMGPDREAAIGDTPVPDVRNMDTALALDLLRRHKEGGAKKTRPRGPEPRRASSKELADAILAKLEILNRRLNKKNEG